MITNYLPQIIDKCYTSSSFMHKNTYPRQMIAHYTELIVVVT